MTRLPNSKVRAHLPPDELKMLVRQSIESFIAWAAWGEEEHGEQEDREVLREAFSEYKARLGVARRACETVKGVVGRRRHDFVEGSSPLPKPCSLLRPFLSRCKVGWMNAFRCELLESQSRLKRKSAWVSFSTSELL